MSLATPTTTRMGATLRLVATASGPQRRPHREKGRQSRMLSLAILHPRRRDRADMLFPPPRSLPSSGGEGYLSPDPNSLRPRSAGSSSLRPHSQAKSASELAGGIEDWEDIDG